MSYSFDFEEYARANTAKVVKSIEEAVSELLANPHRIPILPGNIKVELVGNEDGKIDVVATVPNNLEPVHMYLRDPDHSKRDWTLLDNLSTGFSMQGCPLDLRGLR